jgi:hypothetical protein
MPPVKLPAHRFVLRYTGIFDIGDLYREMQERFEEREYDFYEKYYKHKWKAAKRTEMETWWYAERDINEFVRNVISINIHLWDYEEVEVIKEGVKKKLVKARMQIVFLPELEFDYECRWDDTKLKRKLRDFYIKYVIRHDIDDVWGDKLYYNAYKLHQKIKLFLGMKSYASTYDDMW